MFSLIFYIYNIFLSVIYTNCDQTMMMPVYLNNYFIVKIIMFEWTKKSDKYCRGFIFFFHTENKHSQQKTHTHWIENSLVLRLLMFFFTQNTLVSKKKNFQYRKFAAIAANVFFSRDINLWTQSSCFLISCICV